MKLEAWDLVKHGPTLVEWSRLRGQGCMPELYPSTGLVVGDCVAGFLFLTNSPVAYIDGLTSDPQAPRIRVGRAIGILVRSLRRLARSHHRSYVLLSTGLVGAKPAHAKRLGFAPIAFGQTTFLSET